MKGWETSVINNMDDMETLADKMELKWLNPETSKYVECD